MSQWRRLRSVLAALIVPQRETDLLDRLVDPTKADVRVLSFVNAHGFNIAARERDFAEALSRSDILVRDGAGMKILMKLLGLAPGPNLNGTDFIPRVIDRFASEKTDIALMGTQEPWLSKAADEVTLRGGRVALILDGFQPEQVYVDKLSGTTCGLVVLGMGMPKQERVSMLLREHLSQPMLVINGGAILDFLAGRFPRAPKWMRAIGMEWLYRLAREPGRLFQRYVIGNCVFLWRALRLKLGAA